MLVSTGGVGSAEEPAPQAPDKELELLVSWIGGSFSSTAQASADSDYFDLSLSLTSIWSDSGDGHWFYVEQSLAGEQVRPYRQQIYQVDRVASGLFEIRLYGIPDPGRFIGAAAQGALLADISPADLVGRDGCSILLRHIGDTFVGSTLTRLCPSKINNAEYATSEVTITSSGFSSWDRGFNSDGTLVWGAVEGPYLWDRLQEPAVTEQPEGPSAEEAPEQLGSGETSGEAEVGGETEAGEEPGAGEETEAGEEPGAGEETEEPPTEEAPGGTATG
jgi:hypothetical protein